MLSSDPPQSASPFMVSAHHPYSSTLASSASSSSSSVFSADSSLSHSSVSTASTGSLHTGWGLEDAQSYFAVGNRSSQDASSVGNDATIKVSLRPACPVALDADNAVIPSLRQHPRRTKPSASQDRQGSHSETDSQRQPPSLVRQCDRKVNFVDNLVDSASQIVETIWPLSAVACRSDSTLGGKGVLPLRTFIQETLRRSRTSYSTLQVALYYLILIKAHVPKHNFTMEQPGDGQSLRAMQCGRRMFLAALILASKYLQDRNYSARAWSKISGLNTTEINMNEMTFLTAINWRLHISEAVFQRWTDIVLKYTPSTQPPPSPTSFSPVVDKKLEWRTIIPELTPELDALDPAIVGPFRPGSTFSTGDCPFAKFVPSAEANDPLATATQQTPANHHAAIPCFLEPNPHLLSAANRQFPAFVPLGPLPPPQMTPSSALPNTPAVSISGFSSCRPSMSVAMAQVHNASMARTTLDHWEPRTAQRCPPMFGSRPPLTRRPSLAKSSSSASSPESMISDVSSRSSRSSSISSVSSSACALGKPSLAAQATRRCANLQRSYQRDTYMNTVIIRSTDELSGTEMTSSPESYFSPPCPVPDFADISLRTPREVPNKSGCDDLYHVAARGLCELAAGQDKSQPTPLVSSNRKRGRESVDLSLQHNVRKLVSTPDRNEDDGNVLPDSRIADSFLLPAEVHIKTVQSPPSARLRSTQRLPLQKDMGRKRACCGEEAVLSVMDDRTPGPGMWSGIL